jgi:hypothetical protein
MWSWPRKSWPRRWPRKRQELEECIADKKAIHRYCLKFVTGRGDDGSDGNGDDDDEPEPNTWGAMHNHHDDVVVAEEAEPSPHPNP